MKGEISKLKTNPLILDDRIVRDGLSGIALLTDKVPYFVVGGTAVQSYLPTNCRRPTSDIDICSVQPLNYQRFLEITRPLFEYLQDNGYSTSSKKGSRAFRIEVENKYNEGLLIEFSRRNENSFNNNKNKLERELSNANRKNVEMGIGQYMVSSSEDIIIPKLVRDIHALMKNPLLVRYIDKEEKISSVLDIKKRLDHIEKLRNRSMENNTNALYFDELKFASDVYDIQLLSEIAGINLEYFRKCALDWQAIRENSEERDLFFKNILPLPENFKIY